MPANFTLFRTENKINMNINLVNQNPEPEWLAKMSAGDLIYIIEDNKIYQINKLSEDREGWINFRISKKGCYADLEGWSLDKNGEYGGKRYVLPIDMNKFYFISKKTI